MKASKSWGCEKPGKSQQSLRLSAADYSPWRIPQSSESHTNYRREFILNLSPVTSLPKFLQHLIKSKFSWTYHIYIVMIKVLKFSKIHKFSHTESSTIQAVRFNRPLRWSHFTNRFSFSYWSNCHITFELPFIVFDVNKATGMSIISWETIRDCAYSLCPHCPYKQVNSSHKCNVCSNE